MEIIRKSLKEGAAEAKGLAVIIDVFRAFSCQPLFYHFGASRVILETDPERARELKQQNPDYILVGEVNEVPMEGADLGNSPSEIIKRGKEFFAGKTVIHRTTAGVTGAVAAFQHAEEVVLASFVTAGAVARYIREKNPRTLTLVGMGDRANKPAPEDEACADYVEHLLTGSSYDSIEALQRIVFQVTAQKFLVGGKEYLPREDPIFCLQRDLFDFVLTVRREGDALEVSQVLLATPEAKAGGDWQGSEPEEGPPEEPKEEEPKEEERSALQGDDEEVKEEPPESEEPEEGREEKKSGDEPAENPPEAERPADAGSEREEDPPVQNSKKDGKTRKKRKKRNKKSS
jgi:2-phosphosulfolactate phosphatase